MEEAEAPTDADALYADILRTSDVGEDCRRCHMLMERESADMWACGQCGHRERTS